MTIRIVSYNLLVPMLADRPQFYFKCQPQYLKSDYRLNLIENQIENEIIHHKNTVICLQEVCLSLLPKLELLFRRLNYSLFHNLYGYKCNDYIGIAIAIPISMQLNSIVRIKIGDHIQSISKRDEKQANPLIWGWNICQSILSKFIQFGSDPWKTAMDRSNTLLCLQLVIDGKRIYVGTYHMPCLYENPDVMAIHSSIVKDLMFKISAGEDFILAGDLNLKPWDTSYRALTEKGYIDINYPKSNYYEISYRPNTEQILKSAYREKNGSEPNFTNFSSTLKSSNFCATLDYIFFLGHLTVEEVLKLPDHPTSESYPDQTHPSDHLMIAATFRL